jgi:alpha-tubulin suppressor-like RCC1 family protein
VGLSHACAITSTGVLCWGTNTWGEIGDGTRLTRLTATPIRE